MISDRDTGAGVTIDVGHHNIHAGIMYVGSVTGTAAANTSGNQIFIRTPATSAAPSTHLGFEVAAVGVGAGQITLLEVSNIGTTGAGTEVTMYNMNRDSASTSPVSVKTLTAANAFTTTGAKTTLFIHGIPANMRSTFLNSPYREFILKGATTYQLNYETTSAGTSNFTYNIYFYPESAVN